MNREQTSSLRGAQPRSIRTVEDARRPHSQYRWTIRLVVLAGLMALVAGFVAQNYDNVEVRFLFWQTQLRLGWALLFGAIAGAIFGFLAARFRL